MLRVVVASRLEEEAFSESSPLGISLHRFGYGHEVQVDLRPSNASGLPEVYNLAIDQAKEDDTLLFVHDDVHIDDWFLCQRLEEALAEYDVVGVAGNRRRIPNQGAWPFRDLKWTWDLGNLSGAVAHPQGVSVYGPAPAPVVQIDGLFIAVKAGTLRKAGVRFDPAFKFHFYDLDFCRSCEMAGLKLGTWPIAVTHDSAGSFGSSDWTLAYHKYLKKWGS